MADVDAREFEAGQQGGPQLDHIPMMQQLFFDADAIDPRSVVRLQVRDFVGIRAFDPIETGVIS